MQGAAPVWWRVLLTAAACSALAPRPQCPQPPCELRFNGMSNKEYQFQVEDSKIHIEFIDSKYLRITCEGNVTLESELFPRFNTRIRVKWIQIEECATPRASYAAALDTLNVSVSSSSKLSLVEARGAPPCAAHLAGWPRLETLLLTRGPAPCAALLAPLASLRTLRTDATPLPSDLFHSIKASSLEVLYLTHSRLPALASGDLPRLRSLYIKDKNHTVSLEGDVWPTLTHLTLDPAPEEPNIARFPALQSLTMINWKQAEPEAWSNCSQLVNLTLQITTMRTLKAGWLAACPLLQLVFINYARNISTLPNGFLSNAAALRHLKLSWTSLQQVPEDLLEGAPYLFRLDLSYNRLRELPPSGMFARSEALRELSLRGNDLTHEVLRALSGLEQLRFLELSNNKRLGDCCAGGERDGLIVTPNNSPLKELKQLTYLGLSNTSVTKICRDWRESMRQLQRLELSHTQVSRLSFRDTQLSRDVEGAVVNLMHAPVTHLEYDYEDVLALKSAQSLEPARGALWLDGEPRLQCDCTAYWAGVALRDVPLHANINGLVCSDGRPLRNVSVDALQCAAPELCARAPPACRCSWRERPHGRLVTLRCQGSNITEVPRLAALGPDADVDLLLAHNNITSLALHHIPSNIRTLDLRNNSIRSVEEEVSRALGKVSTVLMEGNPLQCACDGRTRALAAALHGRGAAVCRDRTALEQAVARCPGGGGGTTPLVAVGLGAAAAAVLVVGALCSRRLVGVVKRALRRAGAAPRPYDAFVTFAGSEWAPDAAVALEVTRCLEGSVWPRRVHVQERDWVAGCGVAEAVGEGVGAARRTLAVVSAQWVRRWPELRAAYEPALRDERLLLVVVEAGALAAVPELRQYAAAHSERVLTWATAGAEARLLRAVPPPRVARATPRAPPAPQKSSAGAA